MRQQQSSFKRLSRFRYWTRKGYAAFASIGVCVTIGCLKKNVTERALGKQNVTTATTPKQQLYVEKEQETDTSPSSGWTVLSGLFCLPAENKICDCAAASSDAAAPSLYCIIKRGCSSYPEGQPLFYVTSSL